MLPNFKPKHCFKNTILKIIKNKNVFLHTVNFFLQTLIEPLPKINSNNNKFVQSVHNLF